jgi:hypothetical protein
MTYEEFLATEPSRFDELPEALRALALDRAGDWAAAHDEASREETPATNRVDAYLHRKEGDLANARWWYDRVGESMSEASLDAEWETLARRYLDEEPARGG